ncbi:spore coat protein CotH [Mycoplasmatota bacterium]|nr:spore coat protein CotH [Mycoplasmatota bacterium]
MYFQNRPMGCCPQPEPMPRCRVIHRCCYCDVPHICRNHTHIVNHKIYRHHYIPQYTCSQEHVCQDIQCGSC